MYCVLQINKYRSHLTCPCVLCVTNFAVRSLSSGTSFDCSTFCTAAERKHRLTARRHISLSKRCSHSTSAKWVATLLHVQGVPGSNLELETGCPHRGLSCVTYVRRVGCLERLLSNAFEGIIPPTVLTFDARGHKAGYPKLHSINHE